MPGISCISPTAPADDTMSATKRDSWRAMPYSSSSSMPCSRAAFANSVAKRRQVAQREVVPRRGALGGVDRPVVQAGAPRVLGREQQRVVVERRGSRSSIRGCDSGRRSSCASLTARTHLGSRAERRERMRVGRDRLAASPPSSGGAAGRAPRRRAGRRSSVLARERRRRSRAPRRRAFCAASARARQ